MESTRSSPSTTKLRHQNGLHIVTLVMIVFTCLGYLKSFGTLNVNLTYSPAEQETVRLAEESELAREKSGLEELKAKIELMEEENRKEKRGLGTPGDDEIKKLENEKKELSERIARIENDKEKEKEELIKTFEKELEQLQREKVESITKLQTQLDENAKPVEVSVEGKELLDEAALANLTKEVNDLKLQLNTAKMQKTQQAISFQNEADDLRGQVLELEKASQAKKGPTGWETDTIPLPELTSAEERNSCPEGLYHVDIISNLTADAGEGRKIPKIVHQTGETKCLTKAFYDNAVKWSLEGYSYYFHDAAAKRRLLQKYWLLFPQLQNSFECLKNAGGAAIADLWRYVVVWEYGGVYADMDDSPNTLFNSTTITPEMDAFTIISGTELLAQYFFSFAPKHPVMYLAVHDAMEQMHLLSDTGDFYVPRTTGPSCLMRAFAKFMGSKEMGKDQLWWKYRHPPPGIHYGAINGNRSVEVVGGQGQSDNWVLCNALKRVRKKDGWDKMNFTNYQYMNKEKSNKTCLQLIIERREPNFDAMKELQNRRW